MQSVAQIVDSLQREKKLLSVVNQGLKQNKMEICLVKTMEIGIRAFPSVRVCTSLYLFALANTFEGVM